MYNIDPLTEVAASMGIFSWNFDENTFEYFHTGQIKQFLSIVEKFRGSRYV